MSYSKLASILSEKSIVIEQKEMRNIANNNYLICSVLKTYPDHLIGSASLIYMNLPQGSRFLLESVVVDNNYRNLGIGKSIIQTALSIVKENGGTHLNLTCNPSRYDAHNLYTSIGFVEANTSVLRYYIKP